MGDLMCEVRLVCLRHGEFGTDLGAYSTARPGPALSAAGRSATTELLPRLRTLNVRRVYASPLLRARQTAEVLGAGLALPVDIDDGLAEYDIGEAEGATEDTVRRQVPTVLRSWLLDADLDARIPGGESGAEVLDRFGKSIQQIADRHRGETVAVISHVGTLSLGLATLCAGLSPATVWGRPLGHCVPIQVSYDGEIWRYLSGWPEPRE